MLNRYKPVLASVCQAQHALLVGDVTPTFTLFARRIRLQKRTIPYSDKTIPTYIVMFPQS